MKEEAEKRNSKLSEDDRSKNLKWLVVGRKGEKRLIKGIDREFPDRRERNRENENRDRYRNQEIRELENRDRYRNQENRTEQVEGRDTGARRRETGGWYGRNQPARPQTTEWRENRYRGVREGEEERAPPSLTSRRDSRGTENWRDRGHTPPPPAQHTVQRETNTQKRGRGTTPDSDQEEWQQQSKSTKQ